MKKAMVALALMVMASLMSAAAAGAQTLPGSGELEKINWELRKEGFAVNLPPAAQDKVEVTADRVAYAFVDYKKGVMRDGGQFLFTKAGALYQAEIVKVYNLDTTDGAQAFQDQAAAASGSYLKKLGAADGEDMKAAEGRPNALSYGSMVWKPNSRRAVGPALRIEIRFIASGRLVYYTETCTNTDAAPK